jgi:hypothetical protein
MARERKFEKEKQTHFAKTHQRVMKGHYMTDVDSIQLIQTENKLYQQYTYINNIPTVRRLIEIKSRKTQRFLDSVSGERIEPQFQSQAYMVAELNAFRREHNIPLCEYLIVIQDYNDFPYEVWKCDTTFGTGELNFEYQCKIYDDEEYISYFNTSVA